MSQLNVDRVAVLGAGKMGNTLIHAMRQAGLAADRIVATGRREEQLSSLAEREGVATGTDNRAAVAGADLVLLCVKPQIVAEVLDEIGERHRRRPGAGLDRCRRHDRAARRASARARCRWCGRCPTPRASSAPA